MPDVSIPYPHHVTIQRLHAATGGAQDAWGRTDVTPGWVDLATVPAWVQGLSTYEQALLTQAGAADVKFRVFLDPTDLTTADRIRWVERAGQLLEVQGIDDPDGTGEHWEVMASTRLEAADTLV